MSIEAMNWALKQQLVKDSGACWVLMGLANHAREDGSAAFPSIATLIEYTKLSERTIRTKLRALEDMGVISKGNQKIAQALGYRPDRCPTVYDLHLDLGLEWEERAANLAPRDGRGANGAATGGNLRRNGGQSTTERGATAAPETSFNHSLSVGNNARVDFDDDGQPINPTIEPAPLSNFSKFSMHRDWQPDANALTNEFYRRAMGTNVQWTAADLADFTAHYADMPGQQKSESAWTALFAKWVQTNRRREQQVEQARQQRQANQEQRTANRTASTNTEGNRHANRRPASQQNYDPHAARARARAQQQHDGRAGMVYEGQFVESE
ncbi:DnaT-like ssDNA-binding domain-containing protein [Zymobacter sp. IVIA_5232.4 C2]|uniref:DnaT-like ssDNA-binding domain-containing protein n=1 Tax=Zymobacter sp. IVIA_5232.4 C2 TaxID=3394855 RepID=UPI0039C23C67